MEQGFFTNLPSELTTNILSRLPLRSIAFSKCVCKPWLSLLQSDDFVKSKIKTPPTLARLIPATNSTRCTVYEFEDEDEADVESHALNLNPLTDFEIPHGNSELLCRAQPTNGFLLIHSFSDRHHIYICNPITREYIELCCPDEYSSLHCVSFGFGVSKLSEKYKVVCIDGLGKSNSYHVYTLGTRTWRRVEPGPASGCFFCFDAYIVCNGNPHWTVYDSAQIFWICTFDLETECFSIFSPPLVDGSVQDENADYVKLNVCRDCLCVSYLLDDKVVIWLMKEYRVKESWTMVYQISIDNDDGYWKHITVYPIKVFKNDDVLMFLEEKCLIYYSNKTRTIQQLGTLMDGEDDIAHAMIFTPSLFSLKSFGMENVITF